MRGRFGCVEYYSDRSARMNTRGVRSDCTCRWRHYCSCAARLHGEKERRQKVGGRGEEGANESENGEERRERKNEIEHKRTKSRQGRGLEVSELTAPALVQLCMEREGRQEVGGGKKRAEKKERRAQ